jgi:hypothetical protein
LKTGAKNNKKQNFSHGVPIIPNRAIEKKRKVFQ